MINSKNIPTKSGFFYATMTADGYKVIDEDTLEEEPVDEEEVTE